MLVDPKSVQCPGIDVNAMAASISITCADTASSSRNYSLEDWMELTNKYTEELSPFAANQWASYNPLAW
jgi:hypothetical protein